MGDPIFVVGSPRSGTTLLRVMLAGHPGLFSPPEMLLAPFATMAERRQRLEERFWEKGGLRRAIMELERVGVERAKELEAGLAGLTVPEVYAWIAARLGGRALVDKCPHLAADPAALRRLAGWFPQARWLWLVRHPGSVTRSIENMPLAELMLAGYGGTARDIWHDTNKTLRDFLAELPPGRTHRLQYEPLVADPRTTLTAACAALGIPFHEALLTPYDGDRMREGPAGARAVGDPNLAGRGRIQPELADSWLAGFDSRSVSPATHGLAREFGYDLAASPRPPIAAVSAALGELWDSARRLEAGMRLPGDLDDVEGRRFLLRVLAASVDLFVEEGDVDRPRFHPAETPTRKLFADNPDCDYWRAAIRCGPGRRYRIRGRVAPGTTYVGLLLYRAGGRCGRHLHDRQFVGPDGRFDVTVATDPAATLVATGDEIAVVVRQYFLDRSRERPIELAIELVDGPAARPLEPAALAGALGRARRNLEAVLARTQAAREAACSRLMNRFAVMGGGEGEPLFQTPDNTYVAGWFRLGADQLMLVRGRLPRARYWGACLYNAWLESLEPLGHRGHLNAASLEAGPDGTFELCLAHRDVGHPNWLDTAGHASGLVLLRTLLPEEPVEPPSARVLYESEWTAGRSDGPAEGVAATAHDRAD